MLPEAAVHAEAPKRPEAAEKKNALQVDLGMAVVGLAFERMLDRRLAFHVTGHVFGTWFGPTFDKPNLRGFGGGVRATFFLTHDGGRGLYVAPFLRIDRVNADDPNATAAWGYSTGSFAGWSWVIADRFNVRVGGGLQWLAYQVPIGQSRASFKTLFPALDLVVGYAF